ncbi:hypothetical protein [Billgrantia gudaonensis]|uniref:Uncharacterized protein n=1 Tax=Billgrantia gudaonensis TaxID=376427 RepID=A0A1G9EAR7_9GAMM|nr:hypothetical protein [Halomonas gudaonensis]SDK73262.1 hypothetical protein SAMN04487954_1265 [Halomonas gudaonensis]
MTQRTRIPSAKLPVTLPSEKAMRSYNHNKTNYDPEFWEFEYLTHRYLKTLDNIELMDRLKKIRRNLSKFYTDERSKIPIGVFHSTWYWLRKEHQARFEISLRELGYTLPPPPLVGTIHSRNNRYPDLKVAQTTKLFRYLKKEFAEDMIQKGIFRFSPAETYIEMEGDVARADDEKYKSSVLHGENVKITTKSGQEIRPIGNLHRTTGGIDYHMLCLSQAWDEELFEDFGDATHCVVVNDVDEFLSRIEQAGRKVYSRWYFHHGPVNYYDKYDIGLKGSITSVMHKDCTFAYQEEYRILWARLEGPPVEGHQFLETGNLDDIADLVASPNRSG